MRLLVPAVLLAIAPCAFAEGPLRAIVRVEPGVFGQQPSSDATFARRGLSADTQRILFTSSADNLVAGGGRGRAQVYLADRAAGQLTLVSRGFDGSPGNAASVAPAISADGSHVAFVSTASNLVAGDDAGTSDLFVVRLSDGFVRRIEAPVEISYPHTRFVYAPVLSGNGDRVLFAAGSGSISRYALYAADTATGALTRLTPPLIVNEPVYSVGDFTLSRDGTTAAFRFTYPTAQSAPLTQYGVYALALAGGSPELVTRDGAGEPLGAAATQVELSADAARVAFITPVDGFVSGDGNGQADVIVRDRTTGVNRHGSLLPGEVSGNRETTGLALSPDGTRVAFTSNADNTPAGAYGSTYVRELDGAGTTLLRSALSPIWIAFSGNGDALAFDSAQAGITGGDSNGFRDVFVQTLGSGATVRASLATAGPFATVPCCLQSMAASSSGRWLGLAGMTLAGQVRRFATLDRDGAGVLPVSPPASADIYYATRIGSPDDAGRLIPFAPDFSGIIIIDPPPPPPPLQPTQPATWLVDRVTGAELGIALLPGGGWPNDYATNTVISADGRYAAFESRATDHLPGVNLQRVTQVYRRDLVTGELRLVSSAAPGLGGNADSTGAIVSPDGGHVAFFSNASDLVGGDTNAGVDIFLWDAQSGAIERVNVSSDGTPTDDPGYYGPIALCDGARSIAFVTSATGLVPSPSGTIDAYVRDRVAGTTTRISARADGTAANASTFELALSADCTTAAFVTNASNLGFANNGTYQVYARTLPDGVLRLASADVNGTAGNRPSFDPALSRDGSEALFVSNSDNWSVASGLYAGGSTVLSKSLREDDLFSDGFE